ncbi:hypothetical protein [Cupriavidus pauculus]|uniref:hypothetical protein n=1 Tax=Cupriavidus pauculus TaxID=82633 RepID=UPI001EE30F6B|nr:hypothetical protein [Cupriavidus pauculus]GJG92817.1 hypothetical protein CBA19C6_00030 [Cupriavidus pauculus]
MNILLVRSGDKAILIPAGFALHDCPVAVTRWLGTPFCEEFAELNAATPMPGIDPEAVLDEISKSGFCAIDGRGILRPAHWRRLSLSNFGICERAT